MIGVFDALAAYPLVRRRAREAGEFAAVERPDAAVLIDSWGFNLRVAHAIRERAPAVRLIKYVGPQVWATRPGRARTLARAVDHLLTIHALTRRGSSERDWTRRLSAIPCSPLAVIGVIQVVFESGSAQRRAIPYLRSRLEAVGARSSASWDRSRKRRGFWLRIARTSRSSIPAADAVADLVAARAASWRAPTPLIIAEEERWDAMSAATAALACSGTVTTEFALVGAPVVVAYRLDPPTAAIAKLLIRTPFITLMNVAAGREIAPEYVQSACTGARLAKALAPLLDDPAARAEQSAAQTAALEIMRGGIDDPAGAAAQIGACPDPQISGAGFDR